MSVQVMTLVRVDCDNCERVLLSYGEEWMEEALAWEVLAERDWTWKQSPSMRFGKNHRCPDCVKKQADG